MTTLRQMPFQAMLPQVSSSLGSGFGGVLLFHEIMLKTYFLLTDFFYLFRSICSIGHALRLARDNKGNESRDSKKGGVFAHRI